MNDAALPHPVRRPRNAAPVIAVSRGDEGDPAQPFPNRIVGQHIIINPFRIDAQPLRDAAADGVAAAQRLERVQPEAEGFILDPDRAHV